MLSWETPIPSPSSTTNWLCDPVEGAGVLALPTCGSAWLDAHDSPMGVISYCFSPVAPKTPTWIPVVAVTAAKRHFPHLL